MKENGNPFLEESMDCLIVLRNGNVKKEDSVEKLKKIEDIGQTAYETFVNERLVDREAPVSKTISMNNLFIFNTPKERGKKEKPISNLKNDVSLFSRLFIACQNRDSDLDDFSNMKTKNIRHQCHS